MAVVVFANGNMRKMNDSDCSNPVFEQAGKKQLVTIGEVSGHFQNVLVKKGLIEVGVFNPDEPALSINDMLNNALNEPPASDWAAMINEFVGSV